MCESEGCCEGKEHMEGREPHTIDIDGYTTTFSKYTEQARVLDGVESLPRKFSLRKERSGGSIMPGEHKDGISPSAMSINVVVHDISDVEPVVAPSHNAVNVVPPCDICYEAIKDPINTPCCFHTYCRQCMVQYIDYRVNERITQIPCPNYLACSASWDNIEYLQNFEMSQETLVKYARYELEREIMFDKTRVFCPAANCDAIVTGDLQTKDVECQKCQFKFCFRCSSKWSRFHHCKKDPSALFWWSFGKNLVSCPKCDITIEKNGGCPHMRCTRCSHDFCFWCHRDYNNHGSDVFRVTVCPALGLLNSRWKYFGLDPLTRTVTKTVFASVILAAGATGVALAIPGVPLFLIGQKIYRHQRQQERDRRRITNRTRTR